MIKTKHKVQASRIAIPISPRPRVAFCLAAGHDAALTLSGARHEFMDRVARSFSVLQDQMHLFRDGHFNAKLAGEADCRIGGEHTLGYHAMHARYDFIKLSPSPEFDAHTPVPRQLSRAGQDQITQTGEPRHSFTPAASGQD